MLRNEEIKTLVEALPYLRDFKGKTVVVKYGGNAMLNDDIKTKVLQDIVVLKSLLCLARLAKKHNLSVVCALLTQNPSG